MNLLLYIILFVYRQQHILQGSTLHRVNDYILCLYLHHQMMQVSHKWWKSSFYHDFCALSGKVRFISMNLYCIYQSKRGFLLQFINSFAIYQCTNWIFSCHQAPSLWLVAKWTGEPTYEPLPVLIISGLNFTKHGIKC